MNVFVAMCYYKLDYYDVSLEILAVYLQAHPESAIAVNLKACNHFRLYNGRAAEAELKVRDARVAPWVPRTPWPRAARGRGRGQGCARCRHAAGAEGRRGARGGGGAAGGRAQG